MRCWHGGKTRGPLEAAGLKRYEVSNFARRAGCRHNRPLGGGDYWPWARGPGHLAGVRWAYVADPTQYCQAVQAGEEPLAMREELTPEQRALELILLGLRTARGVELTALAALLGDDPRQVYAEALAELEGRGWAHVRGHRLVPTPAGLAMADAAAALFA